VIADPHEGPRACRTCGWCEHLMRCPTPQACELAEEERRRRASRRDLIAAVALLLAVLGTLALINWR
jgi:ferric-dicitrate binding protein FerR (iron transport regulator)